MYGDLPKNDKLKMTKEQFLDLDEDQLQLVKEIIKQHIPDKKVWVYGSRVTRDAQERSDLDLVVFDCDSIELTYPPNFALLVKRVFR